MFPAHTTCRLLRGLQKKTHSRCSESFYRKEIEIGIKSAAETGGDRNWIIELLKKIEDQNAEEDEALHPPDDESEEDTLADRFAAIDICESPSPRFNFKRIMFY